MEPGMEQDLDIKPEISSIHSNLSDDMDDPRAGQKKIARFKAKHDVFLLKCVLARNPFQCRGGGGSKYVNELIAADMNKVFHDEFLVCQRRVRERYTLLLKQYNEDDMKRRYSF